MPDYITNNKNFESVPRFSCEFAGACGGCDHVGLSYRRSLLEKQNKVSELLAPYVKAEPIVGMIDPYHYRNKAHAVFAEANGKLYSGIYKQGTHKVVPIHGCLIENVGASAIVRDVTALAASFGFRAYNEDTGTGLLRHITVRVAHATGEIMLTLVTAKEMFPSRQNFVKEILKLHPEITTITQNINSRSTSMVFGEKDIPLFGRGYIEDILCGRRFRISPRSFYQVNSLQAAELFSIAKRLAKLTKNDDILDAYCGIGTVGLIMHESCRSVTGIEFNRSAVLDAKINSKLNSAVNCSFFHGDAGEFMIKSASVGKRFSCVFMDPPREGASRSFLSAMLKTRPKGIVYISCNPVTLARDLSVLTRGGYNAVRAIPVDMFPFTEHVECVVEISRKEK